jgi:putative transposase
MNDTQIAEVLGVSLRSVGRWRRVYSERGETALESRGATGPDCRLTDDQLKELRAALEEGPAAHGYTEDQRWTLVRIRDLIWTLFRVRYTSLDGVSGLMKRIRYSWQVPTRRAAERDEDVISAWIEEQWPYIKGLPRRSTPGSASKTRQDKA